MLTAPVVVEKPFTVSSVEADHLLAVAKHTGKLLTCFQSTRSALLVMEKRTDTKQTEDTTPTSSHSATYLARMHSGKLLS